MLVGADRGDMHHPRADRGGRPRHRAGPFALHGIKRLAAALGQDADQVDGHMGIAHRGFD